MKIDNEMTLTKAVNGPYILTVNKIKETGEKEYDSTVFSFARPSQLVHFLLNVTFDGSVE